MHQIYYMLKLGLFKLSIITNKQLFYCCNNNVKFEKDLGLRISLLGYKFYRRYYCLGTHMQQKACC